MSLGGWYLYHLTGHFPSVQKFQKTVSFTYLTPTLPYPTPHFFIISKESYCQYRYKPSDHSATKRTNLMNQKNATERSGSNLDQ